MPLKLAAGLWATVALLSAYALIGPACAHTPAGIQREIAALETGSNVVATIGQAATPVPAPVGPVVQGLCGVATALLAFYNAKLHKSLRQSRARKPKQSPSPG